MKLFTKCLRKLKIFFLRQKGKKLYDRIRQIEDSADCGHHMLRHVSSEYNDLENELDVVMGKLKRLIDG